MKIVLTRKKSLLNYATPVQHWNRHWNTPVNPINLLSSECSRDILDASALAILTENCKELQTPPTITTFVQYS